MKKSIAVAKNPVIFMNKRIVEEAGSCMRLAWYRIRASKEVVDNPTKETLLLYGRFVGIEARKHFPGGHLIEAERFSQMLQATSTALAEGHDVVFEAAFSYRGLGIIADVLRRGPDGAWDLIEVKAGITPDDDYLEDVAIQTWVLRRLGMKIRPFLMLVDRNATIHSEDLFNVTDCEVAVGALLPEIDERIRRISNACSSEIAPPGNIRRYCRECDFFKTCFPRLPEHHVFTLHYGGKKIDALLAKKIEGLLDIPKKMKLNVKQRRQIECVRTSSIWKSKNLADDLMLASYPMYFMDFEIDHQPGASPQ